MTEEEWLECTKPKLMLEFLRGKVNDRKLRLFAFACEMRLWHNDESEVTHLTEAYEQFIEGKIVWRALKRILLSRRRVLGRHGSHTTARYALAAVTEDDAYDAAVRMSGFASGYVYFLAIEQKTKHGEHSADENGVLVAAAELEQNAETEKQALLLRDLIGNPFRPIALNPAWMARSMEPVAQVIYQECRFQDMPILADALEEAGCTNADILNHCRSEGPHVRGCWVLDLILGNK